MKILRLNYENRTFQYRIKDLKFESGVSLLVGASGAGKTIILNALKDGCRLACGDISQLSYSFSLELEFEISDSEEKNHVYLWSVDVDTLPVLNKSEESNLIIRSEKLLMDGGTVILERNKNGAKVIDFSSVPQPKENESLISQYRKEAKIKKIYKELGMVFMRSIEVDMRETTEPTLYHMVCQYYKEKHMSPLMESRRIDMSPFDRLGVIKGVSPKLYDTISEKILEVYQDIFPDVEEITYMQSEDSSYGIAIKTNGNWVCQKYISSGMLKTLWNIIYLLVLPPKSVLLIDELENGLGINCIDSVSELLMIEREDIQKIITSHHPYIINAIPMKQWKIIRREKNVIVSRSAEQYHLGKSKHEAYLQLVNKLKYDNR